MSAEASVLEIQLQLGGFDYSKSAVDVNWTPQLKLKLLHGKKEVIE